MPVYNGEARLPGLFAALSRFVNEQRVRAEVILVDDGSSATVGALLDDYVSREPCARVVRNGRNAGKGCAVARGLREARGRYRIFTDADLAYPLEEALKLLTVLESGSDVAVACRVLPESRYLMSPAFFGYVFTRHVMSRCFNLLVRLFLVPHILDTQAGLKGMSATAVDEIVPRMTVSGFAFDVELLLAARRRGLRIAQVPVSFRYDSEPSTVRFVADGLRMLRDLARIRWNDLRGRYG